MKESLRMTEGSISRKIIMFAIPLFLGNLFQQLYNTADSLKALLVKAVDDIKKVMQIS